MNLTQKTKDFLRNEENREVALLFVTKIISSGMGLIAIIIIARTLEPSHFGIFSLAMGVMIVALEFAGQGIDVGMVRFSSHCMEKDEKQACSMFKSAFKIKLTLSLTVFMIGYFAAPLLATKIFHQPEATNSLRLALLATCGISMWRYILSVLQSYQFFKKYALLDLVNNLLRLIAVAFVCFIFIRNLIGVLAAYAIVPFISFFVGLRVVPRELFKVSGEQIKALKELIKFSRWIIISGIITIIYNRMDIFMLARLKGSSDVGIYAAAFNLLLATDILLVPILTVFLPKVSKIVEKTKYKNYILKSTGLTLILVLILLPSFFLAKPIILTLFGSEFIQSVAIFKILFFGFMVSLMLLPCWLILLSLNLPHYITSIDLSILVFNFVGNYLVIPRYGAVGAAWVTLCTKLSIGIVSLVMVYLKAVRKI